MFGNMIGVAILDAGRLPTHKTAFWIGSQAVDAVQVHAPPRAGLYGILGNGGKGNTGRRVPDLFFVIDTSERMPARSPIPVVAIMIEIDREVDPVAGWRDFEFAIMPDVRPITA